MPSISERIVRNDSTSEKQRIYARIEYRKAHRLRFLGHLDVATVFDRAVRRAQLPVAYTEGFHPRAKITFAQPLPVGTAGIGELCAIDLVERPPTQQLAKHLSRELPGGLDLVSVQILPRTKRSPFADLARADYLLVIAADEVDLNELRQAVDSFTAAEIITVERETKRHTRQINIRPGTHELSLKTDGTPHIQMSLSLRPDDLVKPVELVEVLAERMACHRLPIQQVIRSRLY